MIICLPWNISGTDGYVQFTGLPERLTYTLKVVAETYKGEIKIIKRQFRIGFPFHMHPASEMHDTVTVYERIVEFALGKNLVHLPVDRGGFGR